MTLYRTPDETLCVIVDERTKMVTGLDHVPRGVMGGLDGKWPTLHLAVTSSGADIQYLQRKTIAWVTPATVIQFLSKLAENSASDAEALERLVRVFSETPKKAKRNIATGLGDLLKWIRS